MVRMAWAALALVLVGCGASDQDELRQWMQAQQAQVRPKVSPIAEPKTFTPQAYTEAAAVDPFNSLKLTQALRRDAAQPVLSNLIAPELNRRKEVLEAFPLDAMAMVGSMVRGGQPVALVTVDKLLYQVRVGNHLGLSYGRVTRISETEIDLREIVQDAAGEWVERFATLQLQERSEKTR